MNPQPTAVAVAGDRVLRGRLGYSILDLESGSGMGFEDVRRYSYLASPELSPRATAALLRRLLGRPVTEREARATLAEIRDYGRGRGEAGADMPLDRAAREWEARRGYAFRRRWSLADPEFGRRLYLPGGREVGPGMLGRLVGSALPGLRPLLGGGFGTVSVLARAARELLPYTSEALGGVPAPERSARYHARLVGGLTGWPLSADEAERVGDRVLEHTVRLREREGRDVPVGRATADYFRRLGFAGLGRASLWDDDGATEPDLGDTASAMTPSIPLAA